MNPGCSLVDLLLFPIYFQFRKNKGNKTVWPLGMGTETRYLIGLGAKL